MKYHLRHVPRLFLTVWTCATLMACSAVVAPVPEDATLNTLEVSYARASLVESEFEHFKLQKQLLFVECGTLHRGRYRVKAQDISTLPDDSIVTLREKAYPLFQSLTTEPAPSFDEPGDGSSFFDPGRLTLSVGFSGIPAQKNMGEMKTSVDAVTDPASQEAFLAQKLIESLRAEARLHSQIKTLCGNAEFYGLK